MQLINIYNIEYTRIAIAARIFTHYIYKLNDK